MSGYIRASASASFLTIATIAAAQTSPAPAPVATSRVVYIEVAPSEINRAANALKAYRLVTQKASGAGHIEAVQQIGRPNLFAIHETWNDGAALQTHLMSADNKKLRDDLQNVLLSPIDDRVLASITTQPLRGAVTDDAVYVLTHADAGARREEIPGMLQELAAGARRESGSVLFDATVQPTRTNHFTIVEIWSDQKAYEAHLTAANTRKFREAFAPVSGALYDERIYRRIK